MSYSLSIRSYCAMLCNSNNVLDSRICSWYEYLTIVGLVVAWSRLMFNLEPILVRIIDLICKVTRVSRNGGEEEEEKDTMQVMKDIIEGMTGIEPDMDYTLEECGLASIGLPALVALLNKRFSTVSFSAADLITASTIGDMVQIIDAAKELANDQGL
uniref:Carrier domain-containing protein n=1 Tax=Ditylum brightwellii TaxID=49249 RepID=A0A7S4RGI5_9STRA